MEKILTYLDLKFDFVAVAIEESKNLEQMSLEQLMGYLQEQRLTRKEEDKSSKLYKLNLLLRTKENQSLKEVEVVGNEEEEEVNLPKKHKTTKVNETT